MGNDAIDTDHKHLIGLINQIEICMNAKDFNGLNEACVNLDTYSLVHFTREEKIAKAAGYVHVPNLIEAHVSLIKELDEMRAQLAASNQNLLPELINRFVKFIRHWLIDHVLLEDMKRFATCFPYSITPPFCPTEGRFHKGELSQ